MLERRGISRIKILAFMLFSASALGGCQTKAIPPERAHGIPEFRIYDRNATSPAGKNVSIRLIRDTGAAGGTFLHSIRLDGKLIAALDAGEMVTIWTTSGAHVLSVTPALRGAPEAASQLQRETMLVAEDNKRYTYRIGTNASGIFILRSN